jgi:hypothetical protein
MHSSSFSMTEKLLINLGKLPHMNEAVHTQVQKHTHTNMNTLTCTHVTIAGRGWWLLMSAVQGTRLVLVYNVFHILKVLCRLLIYRIKCHPIIKKMKTCLSSFKRYKLDYEKPQTYCQLKWLWSKQMSSFRTSEMYALHIISNLLSL